MLSESVGKALKLTGGPQAAGTSEFVLIFDKFFDLLNVSDFHSGQRSRKPFCKPYETSDDERLEVNILNTGFYTH